LQVLVGCLYDNGPHFLFRGWHEPLEMVAMEYHINSNEYNFDIIGISEFNLPKLLLRCHDDIHRGGVGYFISDEINKKIREHLIIF